MSSKYIFLTKKAVLFFMVVGLFFGLSLAANAASLYIAKTGGNDAGNCQTQGSPCATAAYAIGQATSGDTINFAAGSGGTYDLTTAINPGTKNITFAGAGTHGATTTILKQTGDFAVFKIDNGGNTSTIRNFIIDAKAGQHGVYISSATANPVIERNIVLSRSGGGHGIFSDGGGATPTIQHNIIIESTGYGIKMEDASGVVRNNTVINADVALWSGTRTNNLAYGGGTAFKGCAAGTATYGLAYRNGVNFNTGDCPAGSTNVQTPPRFLNIVYNGAALVSTKNPTGIWTGLTGTVLTDSAASFGANNSLVGYFLTPDLGTGPFPQYFLITANTSTTITISSGLAMTAYITPATDAIPSGGGIGRPYGITEFRYGTNLTTIASGGSSWGTASDTYGTSQTTSYMGAVAPSGTSTVSGTIFYVAVEGTTPPAGGSSPADSLGTATTCDAVTRPCKTVQVAVAMADSGDKIYLANGTYTLKYRLDFATGKNVTFEGGYNYTTQSFSTMNVGTRSTYATRLVPTTIGTAAATIYIHGPGNSATGHTGTNSNMIVRNFIIESVGGQNAIQNNGTGGPLIERNIILSKSGGGNGILSDTAAATPTIQHNIVVESTAAAIKVEDASGVVRSNTAINASPGFANGTRTSNVAYGGGTAFSGCAAGTATYSDAFENTTNWSGGDCAQGGTNKADNPQFIDAIVQTTSTAVTATTLTKTSAGWATDQWVGYFVTPDVSDSPRQYFLITANTTTQLTVTTGLDMTSYGTAGNTFQITDFSLKTASTLINTGDTGFVTATTDVYGLVGPLGSPVRYEMGAAEYRGPGVTITESSGSTAVTEAGGTDMYTAVLNYPPTATVTLNITPNIQLTTTPSGTTTFTTTNWNIEQTITVAAVNDTTVEALSHTGTIAHTTSSSDAAQNGLTVAGITATVTDDGDVAPVVSVQSAGGDTLGPASPREVTALSKDGKIILSWKDPTDSDLASILLFRGRNTEPSTSTLYQVLGKNIQTFIDSDVVVGDTVKYFLMARDYSGNNSTSIMMVSVKVAAKEADMAQQVKQATEVGFSDTTAEYVLRMVNYMLEKKTYEMPPSRAFGANLIVNKRFALRVALAISGGGCGSTKEYPGFIACREEALRIGLIDDSFKTFDRIKLIDYYAMMLKSLNVEPVTNATVTQLKQVCKDVKFPTKEIAGIFFTARRLGAAGVFSGGKCNLNLAISRSFAMKLASRVLDIKSKTLQ